MLSRVCPVFPSTDFVDEFSSFFTIQLRWLFFDLLPDRLRMKSWERKPVGEGVLLQICK
jgi:hypothetical protein